ncbi:MAG: HU family DNA-binding protein, partial [Candidatus Hinthialibacter sp.]
MKKAAAKKSNAKKPITKSQLIAHLSEQCELTKKQVNDVLAELAAVGYKEAKKGFTIPGLGK